MNILFILAHPDDETFGSGGTIAKMHQGGAKISLITATYGQAGQTGKYGKITPKELGEIRKNEQEEACKILGISKIHYFGLKDGELYKCRVSTLVRKIMPILKEEDPDIVITFGKDGGSNHPDHKKISAAATRAFVEYIKRVKKRVRLYHTVIPNSHLKKIASIGIDSFGFGKLKGVRDDNVTTVVDISNTFEIKKKAALCHKSQMEDVKWLLKIVKSVGYEREFFRLILENKII